MKLLPVPGAPGYRVDTENRQAYSMKRGILRPIKFRTKYKTAVLTINGKAYGTTIWRMMYCVQNAIDITKIPSDLCINLTNGILTVASRSDIQKFQSTPPHGGRQIGCLYPSRNLVFQSTPPHGGRLASSSDCTAKVRFNPRPRMGGEKAEDQDYQTLHGFNPRPRMGGDAVLMLHAQVRVVSIHAPAWGATASSAAT